MTGYLTIKEVHQGQQRVTYTLGWPNGEVKDSFYESLIREYAEYSLEEEVLLSLSEALLREDLNRFFSAFNAL